MKGNFCFISSELIDINNSKLHVEKISATIRYSTS